MSEHNRHRRLLYWLVGILFLLAAAIFFVKLRYFDFSLDNRAGFFYRADASVAFDPEPGKEIRIAGPPATAAIRSPAAKNNSGLNCRTGCVAPCSNCRPAPAARPFHTGSG